MALFLWSVEHLPTVEEAWNYLTLEAEEGELEEDEKKQCSSQFAVDPVKVP